MNLLLIFSLISLFVGMCIFCSVREHFLSSLLSLEFMVLGVFMLFILCLDANSYFYTLVYIIVAACEGALGLSVLIIMSRSHGGDYFRGVGLLLF